jgi:hypothetical protein
MKIVAFVKTPEGSDLTAFRAAYLESFAPSLLEKQPACSGLTVNVARDTDPKTPSFADIYVELWVKDGQSVRLEDLAPPQGTQYAYRVEERLEKGTAKLRRGRLVGVKALGPLYPLPSLSDEECVSRWDEHVRLALKIHVGMSRYVRDVVKCIGTEGAPHIFGIAQLSFPSEEALRDQFFDKPESVPIIANDVARFVDHYDTAIMDSYVLK